PPAPPPWCGTPSAEAGRRGRRGSGSPTARSPDGRSDRAVGSCRATLQPSRPGSPRVLSALLGQTGPRGLDLAPQEPHRPDPPGQPAARDLPLAVVAKDRVRRQPHPLRHLARPDVALVRL